MRKQKKTLPVDIAVCTAAITDFKPTKYETKKIKKDTLNLNFKRNIDILEFLSKNNSQRPKLVVGFAAETNNILKDRVASNNHIDVPSEIASHRLASCLYLVNYVDWLSYWCAYSHNVDIMNIDNIDTLKKSMS